MARPLRTPLAGGAYHVYARGNARQRIFLDDWDNQIFLDGVVETLLRFNWCCLAYCLMPNHYHLVLRTARPDLSQGMRQINGVYAQRFNRRYGRTGHVFQGRFGATLVQADGHLLEAIRYVVQNPVRAELAEGIGDWRWSSHSEVLGLAPRKAVAIRELLTLFAPGDETGLERYLEFVSADCQNLELESLTTFGDQEFEAMHQPQDVLRPEVSAHLYREDRPPLVDLLRANDRDRAIADAYRVHGYKMREIAEALGCHYATVSRRIRRAEAREADE
jgi:putative transposase